MGIGERLAVWWLRKRMPAVVSENIDPAILKLEAEAREAQHRLTLAIVDLKLANMRHENVQTD